jgi:hypothetical protein
MGKRELHVRKGEEGTERNEGGRGDCTQGRGKRELHVRKGEERSARSAKFRKS